MAHVPSNPLILVFQKNPSVWLGAGVEPPAYMADSSNLETTAPSDELKKAREADRPEEH